MKRNILLIVHISLSVMCGGLEDGVAWLHHCLGNHPETSAMERLRIVRTQSVVDGAVSDLSVLPEDVSEVEDLVADLRKGVVQGGSGWKGACLSEVGGWCAETGSYPDIGPTLVALGMMLDAGNGPADVVANNVSYVESWLERLEAGEEMSFSEGQSRRYRLESLVALGLARRSGALCLASEARLIELKTALAAEVAEQMGEDESSVSLYDAALLARGMRLLGELQEAREFTDWLLARQCADGGWEDDTAGSGIAATCAAVEALAGGECGSVELKVAVASAEGVNGRFVITVEHGTDGYFSVDVRDDAGVNKAAYCSASGAASLSVQLSGIAPGEYDLVVRLWSAAGGVQVGEAVCRVVISAWFQLDSLEIVSLGTAATLLAGRCIALQPQVSCLHHGNVEKTGRLSMMIYGPEGECIGQTSVMNWRGISGCGSFTQCIGEWSGVLETPGYYDACAVLEVDGVEHSAHRVFYVGAPCEVEVDNELASAAVTADSVSGTVSIGIRMTNGGAEGGLAAGFSGPKIAYATDAPGSVHEVCIEGICDGGGALLETGWLVVRSDYGECLGGQTVRDFQGNGSLTIHEVSDGQCRFGYCGGGNGLTGVTPLAIYAGACHDGIGECHDKIGVVELILEE